MRDYPRPSSHSRHKPRRLIASKSPRMRLFTRRLVAASLLAFALLYYFFTQPDYKRMLLERQGSTPVPQTQLQGNSPAGEDAISPGIQEVPRAPPAQEAVKMEQPVVPTEPNSNQEIINPVEPEPLPPAEPIAPKVEPPPPSQPETPAQAEPVAAPAAAAGDGGEKYPEWHPKSPAGVARLQSIKAWWTPWVEAINAAKPNVKAIVPTSPFGNPKPDNPAAPRVASENVLELTDAEIQEIKGKHDQFRKFLNDYPTAEADVDKLFKGKGIVMVGGGYFFGPAIVTIQMLRDVNNDMPVEVFLESWSDYEPQICDDYLAKLNAKCLVIPDHLDNPKLISEIDRYQYKSIALLFSSFEEVILLDADSMPLVNPAEVFDTDAFKLTGLITWPDYWGSSESPDFWTKIAGRASFPDYLPALSPESGQMVLDKRRHFRTLLLAMYYNIYGPGMFYTLFSQGAAGEGDKTTFEMAADVAGKDYYRVHQQIECVGRFIGPGEGEHFMGSAIMQHMPEPVAAGASGLALRVGKYEGAPTRIAFMHASSPKLNAGYLVDGGDLFNLKGERHRLLGSLEFQMGKFGEDIEKRIWGHMVQSSCKLESAMRDWGTLDTKDICGKVKLHYDAIFGTAAGGAGGAAAAAPAPAPVAAAA